MYVFRLLTNSHLEIIGHYFGTCSQDLSFKISERLSKCLCNPKLGQKWVSCLPVLDAFDVGSESGFNPGVLIVMWIVSHKFFLFTFRSLVGKKSKCEEFCRWEGRFFEIFMIVTSISGEGHRGQFMQVRFVYSDKSKILCRLLFLTC